jgi:putative transcriptional regulator
VRNRIRDLRVATGMSQGALADALGVSRQTIGSVENARSVPSLPLAFAIARCFDATIEEIFIPEGDRP